MTARFVEQRTVDPADLDPYPGNPNVGDIDAIRASLRANGQYRAPVARLLPSGRLQVLAGHATRTAATAEAMQLRVDVVEADDATARRIVLADNRTAQLASYDEVLLLSLLDAGDLVGTGWDETAYRDLVDQAMASGGHRPSGDEAAADDTDPTPPDDPVTRSGDLWILGEHRLLCADATDPAAWTRLMAGERADAVWTDPPYGVDIVGGSRAVRPEVRRAEGRLDIANDDMDVEALTVFLRALLTATIDHCAPGAAWYVAAPSGPMTLAFARVLTELGIWRHYIIWVKDSFVFGRADYHSRHEIVYYGWKPGAAHHPVAVRTQDDVWEIPRPRRSEDHPTMKPTELVTRALLNSTDPGAIVAEPCSGSGTTVLAAEITGRRARALEIDPKYADVTARRWQELTGNLPVLARTGEPVDLVDAHDRTPISARP